MNPMAAVGVFMGFLSDPGLPGSSVNAVVVSGEYPEFTERLRGMGIAVISTAPCPSLAGPVAYHADMQLCDFGKGHAFALKESFLNLNEQLSAIDILLCETEHRAEPIYPRDILCNCLILGGYLFGRLDAVDPAILKYAGTAGLEPVNIKQGYAACSSCVISGNAVITEDPSIAAAAGERRIDVLKITAGNNIMLPGYDTGFIGGCSGKLDLDTIVFTGDIKTHSDFERIDGFLRHYDIRYICLSDNRLLDIGGIIPVIEA